LTAVALPPPPPAAELKPAVEAWEVGKPLIRLYEGRRGPLGFNPADSPGRFRPIHDSGAVVPTAYAADDEETALAEVLLRGADALGDGRVPRLYRQEVKGIELVRLVPTRELRLARLNGPGLTRLKLLRTQLIDLYPPNYPYTAAWAQALYDCPTVLDGISWTSRQNDSGRAVVLWQGPIDPEQDLEQDDDPIALDSGPGLELVRQAAVAAGFVFSG
jgi:hypothetical protein